MSPVVKLSVSLAAADTCSSFMFAIIIFFLTFQIPFIYIQFHCELIRLSAIVITVFHLLSLCLNHYISILKPLHYNAICTERKVTCLIVFLWICPIHIVILLFTWDMGFQFWDYLQFKSFDYDSKVNTRFFRVGYSSLFFVPMILMSLVYTHILLIVKFQQKKWKKLSRLGSTRWRGGDRNTTNNRQRQLEGSLKALYTSLLIMGSCIICWSPALLMYSLLCEVDCFISGDRLQQINVEYESSIRILRLIENILLIMKMFGNPIIYTIRMKEIQVIETNGKFDFDLSIRRDSRLQEGRRRMYLALKRKFCPSSRQDSNYALAYQNSPLYQSGTSLQVRLTSFRGNGHNNDLIEQHHHCYNNTFL